MTVKQRKPMPLSAPLGFQSLDDIIAFADKVDARRARQLYLSPKDLADTLGDYKDYRYEGVE